MVCLLKYSNYKILFIIAEQLLKPKKTIFLYLSCAFLKILI